ncbi:hypothetical protein C8R47DRAFT_1081377 [Mycena vitilis]|nr:hypothetical protein C8R47DRAFT_1081377 [Mycena vitilis]
MTVSLGLRYPAVAGTAHMGSCSKFSSPILGTVGPRSATTADSDAGGPAWYWLVKDQRLSAVFRVSQRARGRRTNTSLSLRLMIAVSLDWRKLSTFPQSDRRRLLPGPAFFGKEDLKRPTAPTLTRPSSPPSIPTPLQYKSAPLRQHLRGRCICATRTGRTVCSSDKQLISQILLVLGARALSQNDTSAAGCRVLSLTLPNVRVFFPATPTVTDEGCWEGLREAVKGRLVDNPSPFLGYGGQCLQPRVHSKAALRKRPISVDSARMYRHRHEALSSNLPLPVLGSDSRGSTRTHGPCAAKRPAGILGVGAGLCGASSGGARVRPAWNGYVAVHTRGRVALSPYPVTKLSSPLPPLPSPPPLLALALAIKVYRPALPPFLAEMRLSHQEDDIARSDSRSWCESTIIGGSTGGGTACIERIRRVIALDETRLGGGRRSSARERLSLLSMLIIRWAVAARGMLAVGSEREYGRHNQGIQGESAPVVEQIHESAPLDSSEAEVASEEVRTSTRRIQARIYLGAAHAHTTPLVPPPPVTCRNSAILSDAVWTTLAPERGNLPRARGVHSGAGAACRKHTWMRLPPVHHQPLVLLLLVFALSLSTPGRMLRMRACRTLPFESARVDTWARCTPVIERMHEGGVARESRKAGARGLGVLRTTNSAEPASRHDQSTPYDLVVRISALGLHTATASAPRSPSPDVLRVDTGNESAVWGTCLSASASARLSWNPRVGHRRAGRDSAPLARLTGSGGSTNESTTRIEHPPRSVALNATRKDVGGGREELCSLLLCKQTKAHARPDRTPRL